MTDEEILIWYESLESSTCNTNSPEQAIIGRVKELVERAHVDAVQAAAENIRVNMAARGAYSSNWEQGFLDGQKCSEDEILSLVPAAAHIRAELRVARAKLEVEEWWHRTMFELLTHSMPFENHYCDVFGNKFCRRLANARAVVIEFEGKWND